MWVVKWWNTVLQTYVEAEYDNYNAALNRFTDLLAKVPCNSIPSIYEKHGNNSTDETRMKNRL